MEEGRVAASREPRRRCELCHDGREICHGEVVSIASRAMREVYIRCAPLTQTGGAAEQAQRFYGCLPRLLAGQGGTLADVVHERAFFRDVRADMERFAAIRQQAYESAAVPLQSRPLLSHIEQPPCVRDQAFELQVYAVVGAAPATVQVQSFPEHAGAQLKRLQIGAEHHLYITHITGCDEQGKLPPTFRQQSDAMFQKAARLLRGQGVPFTQVLRTWCYLDDIDRDYAEFNLSRNAFFGEQGVTRLPASTGIRAGLYPPGTLCAMDLYVLMTPEATRVEVMHTPTLNEAPEYGSAFSRGMRVTFPDRKVLFISGTASVDELGATVHIDDVRRQIERMLLNVRELMRADGTFADVVQVITYLKSAEYLDVMQDVARQWGLVGMPNTLVKAGVCRPNLLCEMEAIAIVPSS